MSQPKGLTTAGCLEDQVVGNFVLLDCLKVFLEFNLLKETVELLLLTFFVSCHKLQGMESQASDIYTRTSQAAWDWWRWEEQTRFHTRDWMSSCSHGSGMLLDSW